MTGASLTFTRTVSLNGTQTKSTQYILGWNTRSEQGSRVDIYNRDLGYHFRLDLAQQYYMAYRTNEYGSPKWSRPVSTEPLKRSGRTTHHHLETVDTGERKQLFGWEARRVITKTRTTRDSQIQGESECDGWYINPPAAWLALHPPPPAGTFTYLASGAERDDYKFTEAGKRENGFALFLRRSNKSFLQDEQGNSKSFETTHEEEVTELSEAALTRELFVPPRSCKRVALFQDGMRYRLGYRARFHWELLKDLLVLPRKVAEFVR